MDRVAGRVVALQAVKVETGKVHVPGAVAASRTSSRRRMRVVHPRVNLGLSGFPEGFQLLILVKLFIMAMCSLSAYTCQLFAYIVNSSTAFSPERKNINRSHRKFDL